MRFANLRGKLHSYNAEKVYDLEKLYWRLADWKHASINQRFTQKKKTYEKIKFEDIVYYNAKIENVELLHDECNVCRTSCVVSGPNYTSYEIYLVL